MGQIKNIKLHIVTDIKDAYLNPSKLKRAGYHSCIMEYRLCVIALFVMAVATLGSGRSVPALPTEVPTEPPSTTEELPLPVTAMRWIPGGLSLVIFFAFTIAASVKVFMDKDELASSKTGDEPDNPGEEIAEVDFFKTDVISKLKPGKKNIFQRRLLQNKQKKFGVYDKMMRQYKDDVIAKRAQDARHAEIQKEKEEKERQKEAEIAEQKKKAIEEHKKNTLKRKQEKLRMQQLEGIEASRGEDDGTSEGTLTPAVTFTRTQGDSDNALASDRSVSPNDSGNALAARNTDTSRSSSPTANPAAASEDGQDTGIMLKMKSKDNTDVAETSFMQTDESQAQNQASLNVPQLEVHPPEGEGDEARDVITPLRSRPYTWSEADFDQKVLEDEAYQQAYQRLSSTSSNDDDENTKKMNAMIERFAQNARESRGIVDPDESEESAGASEKKKSKKDRPRTWSHGATYGEEGQTDS